MRWLFTKTKVVALGMHPFYMRIGATTVWERWNSLLSDGTISGTKMNSMNHYSYGAVMEWMFKSMAGFMPKRLDKSI